VHEKLYCKLLAINKNVNICGFLKKGRCYDGVKTPLTSIQSLQG
jgi:hypothetical protein